MPCPFYLCFATIAGTMKIYIHHADPLSCGGPHASCWRPDYKNLKGMWFWLAKVGYDGANDPCLS